jgi:hypothetical protein
MLTPSKLASIAALPLLSVLFGAAPAAAGGCGYSGCGGEVVVVQPQTCGCESSAYSGGYTQPYAYQQPSYYYGGYGAGLYRGGYGGGAGFYRRGIYGGFRAGWRVR